MKIVIKPPHPTHTHIAAVPACLYVGAVAMETPQYPHREAETEITDGGGGGMRVGARPAETNYHVFSSPVREVTV